MRAKFINEEWKLDPYEKDTIDRADEIIVNVGPRGGLRGFHANFKNGGGLYIDGDFWQSLKLAYEYAKSINKKIIFKQS